MSGVPGPLVVIGLGNVLLRDDGVGVHVVAALRRLVAGDPGHLPPRTRLVDGGTLGRGLLEPLTGAKAAIFIDAVDLGGVPGTVTVFRDGAIAATGSRRSGHGPGGLGELLEAARLLGTLPPALALVGVQVEEIDIGLSLSARVEAALPGVIEAVLREAGALGAGWSVEPGIVSQLAGVSA